MLLPIFITGIGTDAGKTIVAAAVTEALRAVYWKPVQAGISDGTDTQRVAALLTNGQIQEELYCLNTPASPHIAAKKDGVRIDIDLIAKKARVLGAQLPATYLVTEGAGGLLVPLNEQDMVADLIQLMQAKVILVSRNYLGSINHSLLTAAYCRSKGMDVLGWIFNDDYLQYEAEIVAWSGYPLLGRIPKLETIDNFVIGALAEQLRPALLNALKPGT